MQRLKKIVKGIRDFFPIHLLLSHFKYNIIVLIYWVLLFSIINGYFGQSFGLQFLFLSPEYLGESSFLSFLLLGFGLGGFIMAFHTYSYIRIGPKYPFIATLSRPFFKFCINNSLLPGIFIFNLAYNIFMLQKRQEFIESTELLVFVVSFVAGCLLFISIAFLYFFPTNKDLFKITGKRAEDFVDKTSNIKSTLHRKEKWYSDFLDDLKIDEKIINFITGKTPQNVLQKHYLKLYKLGEGPYYCFYTPYHLCHFEVPNTVARAVLFDDATITPIGAPEVEVIAIAKKDLKAGEKIDGIGHYMTYGECENSDVVEAEQLLPLGVAEGCILTRDIKKDEALTYNDVEVPKGRIIDDLLRKQREHFGTQVGHTQNKRVPVSNG